MLAVDQLIDRFVRNLNAAGKFEPFLCHQVPESLRTGTDPEHPDRCKWQIKPVPAAPWIDDFEQKLFAPLPPSFRSLVRRYSFLEFEIGPILMCHNTGADLGDESMNELVRRHSLDAALHQALVPAGLLHFARENTGGYDPICFDTHRVARGEYPVVQVDHEETLCNYRVEVVAELAPSFRSMVEVYLTAT